MAVEIDVYDEQGKEIRDHGTLAFPIAHYSGDWKTASVQLHWHEELEAGYVTAGQITMYVGKEKILLREGDGFLLTPAFPMPFWRRKIHRAARALWFSTPFW